MVKSILVLNGPGLDRLGEIDRDRYGSATLGDVKRLCETVGAELGYDVDFQQSNDTGDMLKWIVDARDAHVGIVINPAIATRDDPQFKEAYVAIMHALEYAKLPTIEVHLSNVFAQGRMPSVSYVSTASLGLICGFGIQGYQLALKGLADNLSAKQISGEAVISI